MAKSDNDNGRTRHQVRFAFLMAVVGRILVAALSAAMAEFRQVKP